LTTNTCWCQKTRVIAVSCGTKISAVPHLVLSQYMHLTDRWTDGQTGLRQQYRALRHMPHGKKHKTAEMASYLSTLQFLS